MRRRAGRLVGGRTTSLANANAYFSGIWSLADVYHENTTGIWPNNWIPGLAGKFFNGVADATLGDGSTGFTLPLDTTNNSTNVTGTGGMPADYRFGVNIWSYITYSTIGDSYGFIAIGYFYPPATGLYTFYTSSDDGSGVWIGLYAQSASGRTTTNATLNNGMQAGGQADTKRSNTIYLNAGVRYPIRIVHQEGGGGDNLTFSWSSGSITETTSLLTYFRVPNFYNGRYNYVD